MSVLPGSPHEPGNERPRRELPPWHLVTNSALPDEHYIRETAIALLAADAVSMHDSSAVENAVAWSRAMMSAHESAKHDGDCTNQPMTCLRCFVDAAMEEARQMHGEAVSA